VDTAPEDDSLLEVQELIWALLDELISESDFKRLEEMLRGDKDVRRLYVQCVQIHVDLRQWFATNEQRKLRPLPGLDLPFSREESPMADPAF
jgi:hypothetical protein